MNPVMKEVLLDPRGCNRAGSSWSVEVGDNVCLTGTVLHSLQNPGEIAVYNIDGKRLSPGDLSLYALQPKQMYDEFDNPVGTFVSLPPPLRILDTILGAAERQMIVDTDTYKPSLAEYIGKTINNRIVHPQASTSGQMAFMLGAPKNIPSGHIAISLRDAKRMVSQLIKEDSPYVEVLINRLPEDKKNYLQLAGGMLKSNTMGEEVRRKCISYLASSLDGMVAKFLRYPNASSTSHRSVILRVLLGAPSSSIFVPIGDIIKLSQGDFDGDLGAYYLSDTQTNALPPNIMRYTSKFAKAEGTDQDFLNNLAVPEDRPPLEVMDGFIQRGRWIGLVTFNMWLLIYAAAKYYDKLGYKQPNEVKAECLDLITPIIENAMNARKGKLGAVNIPQMFCDVMRGLFPYKMLINKLPIRQDNEDDENKFTKRQAVRLNLFFSLLADERGIVDILSEKGPCTEAVIRTFYGRFKKEATEELLALVPKGLDLYTIVRDSLLIKKDRSQVKYVGTIKQEDNMEGYYFE